MKNKIKSYLTPPGFGVHTVHTASEKKIALCKEYYNTVDFEEIQVQWEKDNELDNNKIYILGIPSDSGGGIHRGANWGPLEIRKKISDLYQKQFIDLGDIKVNPHLLHDKYLNTETIKNCQQAMYNGRNLPVSPLSIAEDYCKFFYKTTPDSKLLVLGGDHSVSYPVVLAYLKAKRKTKKNIGIIHFDAHTDLLDQRLGIDLCFGSWAYHALSHLKKKDDLIQIGIRSSGKDRNHWENTLGIKQYWANEFHNQKNCMEHLLNHIKTKKFDEVYISVDIDALDSTYAGATGTPENGGLFPDDIISTIKNISEITNIGSADLVEVAPYINPLKINNSIPCEFSTLLCAEQITRVLLECMNNE